jgi:LytS/YehU family sensor histidine kinase
MSADRVNGPHKVVLGSYDSHAAAQKVVEILAEHRFPVQHVAIVGTGLKLKEVIVGRYTLGRALLVGALIGGWIGLLVGLVFLVVSPWPLSSMISSIVLGVIFGLIWAAIARAWHQQSFAAVPAIVADRYDVLVDARFAEEARRILATAVAAPAGRAHHPA